MTTAIFRLMILLFMILSNWFIERCSRFLLLDHQSELALIIKVPTRRGNCVPASLLLQRAVSLATHTQPLVHGELLALDTHLRPLLQRPGPLWCELGVTYGAAAYHFEHGVVPAQK